MRTRAPRWNRFFPSSLKNIVRPFCYYLLVRNMRPDRIPLFPLNVVLLPGGDLPLHIFEPRYRKMVRDCLDNKSEFGMLLALSDGVAGTGCTAEILEVVNR